MNTNKRLSVHHIGGRSGSRAFPVLRRFEEDIINVLYDADPDCLAQIQERNQNLGSELHVLPYCLGDACKQALFNINYDPYTSSLYDPNPDYNSFYSTQRDHDCIFSEATRVMEKRRVETVSIDHIFQSKNVPMPPPDFLSIDTQGSEYDILLGAKETLESSVVALAIEVEFHPIYRGQRLFGDLVKLLSEQGFDFVRFLHMGELSPFRAPIGLRGEGFHIWAEALFFRRMDNMDRIGDELRRYVMLRKLAFIAIIFNQFEYGLKCLCRSKDLVIHHSPVQQEVPVYLEFLSELEQCVGRMPTIYPDTFTSKYTSFAASKSRFESSATDRTELIDKTGATHRIKQLLRQVPILFLFFKMARKGLIGTRKKTKRLTIIVKSSSKRLLFKRYSEVEALLISYGLKSQAETLRKNRIIQSQFWD